MNTVGYLPLIGEQGLRLLILVFVFDYITLQHHELMDGFAEHMDCCIDLGKI